MLVVLLLLTVAVNAMNVVFTDVSGTLMTALSGKNAPVFLHEMLILFVYYVIGTPIVVYAGYLQSLLGLYWRRWLTHRFLDDWLGGRAYYRINAERAVDNPDERISQDINSFANDALNYLLSVLGSLITFFSFVVMLWQISPLLMGVVVVYAVGGTVVTVWLGRPLFGLNFAQLRKEADFRFNLVHVRRNAESIAFYQGEAQEAAELRQRFREVVTNFRWLIGWQRNLGFFQTPYNYMIGLIPALVIAPLYFSGKAQFGTITQASMAFGQILGALTLVVGSFDGLSGFVARINRVAGFAQALRGEDRVPSPQRPVLEAAEGPSVVLDRVTLMTPRYERVLVRDLSAAVRPGEGLLVVGPSGAGKSSLLRAVAGLWTAGEGRVERPPLSEMMFLPQRPYMALGSLRRNLTYPGAAAVGDDRLRAVLERVDLADLPERVGGLDAELDWADVLSLGEQQRVAFARLLLLRPRYAVLDEATSALDLPSEDRLYRLVVEGGTTLVSVGHRPSLRRYHRAVLELPGDGTWRLAPAAT
jgi:putative ATP-binding cassette transporter